MRMPLVSSSRTCILLTLAVALVSGERCVDVQWPLAYESSCPPVFQRESESGIGAHRCIITSQLQACEEHTHTTHVYLCSLSACGLHLVEHAEQRHARSVSSHCTGFALIACVCPSYKCPLTNPEPSPVRAALQPYWYQWSPLHASGGDLEVHGNVTGMPACAQLCSARAGCGAWQWNLTSRECALHTCLGALRPLAGAGKVWEGVRISPSGNCSAGVGAAAGGSGPGVGRRRLQQLIEAPSELVHEWPLAALEDLKV